MIVTRQKLVGTDAERHANLRLLEGAGCYSEDVRREGEVVARVVRSTVAHARIASIDTTAALAHPQVLTVITADDLPDVRIPIRLPFADTPEARRFLQPPLARGVVRYVGEPVAVVVATDQYVAEDAAELVVVEYDELEPVLDVVRAGEAASPRLFPEAGPNVVNTIAVDHGDVDDVFARADVVVRERLRMHRHTAVPLETRGLVAAVDPDTGRLTIWGAAKVKHFTKQALSAMLGLDPERLRLVEVDVGGGFGVRGEPYPEDFLIAFLALRLGRPVKWIEDRAEHFVATNHAREQEHEWEIAAGRDGRLLGFRVRAWCDHGAYVRSQGTLPELLPVMHFAGPYAWSAFAISSTGVLTNMTPVGTYRGPGMTEATFTRERLLDRLARELGLDPAELRRRNLIDGAAMPFHFALNPGSAPVPPLKYESGDYPRSFQALLAHAGYEELLRDRDTRRAGGERAGVGLATYIEIGGIGPFEDAHITLRADGTAVVRVGVGSLGQGVETTLAQIAGEALGLDPRRIVIDHHDTDGVAVGFGSFASRSTVMAGNAIVIAAQDLLTRMAAEDGGEPGEPGARYEGHGRFEKPHPTFSFGGALSLVTVDEETGRVRVLRHVVMHDIGRAVNPALLRGQLAGAASQGIGAALYEELAYDDNGQPLATTFSDYLMPTTEELPPIEVLIEEQPTTANPLGVKGGGESGMVGTPAAVANAVADALGVAGEHVTRLPLTPNRVRALLREAG